MSKWTQDRANTHILTAGKVQITVRRGDFGRWYWSLWDGNMPIDKAGNFDSSDRAKDYAEDVFNAYLADYNTMIELYLMALSFFVVSEQPTVKKFKEGEGDGIEAGAVYIFYPAGERENGIWYNDTWVSPLCYLGWLDGYQDVYRHIYFDKREQIFKAEQNKVSCDRYLRAAILDALGLPFDHLDLRIKGPGGQGYDL